MLNTCNLNNNKNDINDYNPANSRGKMVCKIWNSEPREKNKISPVMTILPLCKPALRRSRDCDFCKSRI